MGKNRLKAVNATWAYSLLQVVCWGFFAISLCFSSNVLYDYGFSDSKISIFLGICTALSFLLQLVTAEVIAANPRCKVWVVLAGLGAAMMAGNLLMLVKTLPGSLAVVCFGIGCMGLLMLPSLVNAIGMDAIRRGSPTNYSIARGLGSLGYSILAFLTGFLVRQRGSSMVPVLGAVCAAALVLGAVWFHFAGEQNLEQIPRARNQGQKQQGFLKQYPRFTLFLLASVLIQYSHNLPSNFMYQIMLSKNGGAAEQGIASAICAFVELPVMFFFPLLMRRIRCDKWVRFSALFTAVKAVGILLAMTPSGVYLAQATQSLGYGLFVISSVNYAEMVVGRGESVRAQTYLGATCTVGALLATGTGGFLCQHLGVPAMVLTSFLLAFGGGLLILFTAEKTKQ